ncbi:MAG: hypothetical protein V1763_01570 [Parcubacteria group bacterium]
MEKENEKINEVLTAVQGLSTKIDNLEKNTDSRFDELLSVINVFADQTERRFESVDARFDGVDARLDKIEGRVDGVEGRLSHVEGQMVTKDYLDNKLADLRGDLIVALKKEDGKVDALSDVLCQHKIITDVEKQAVVQMSPFPKLV